MQFMLHTHTVSYFLKGEEEVTGRVINEPMGTFCISAVTKAELLFWGGHKA